MPESPRPEGERIAKLLARAGVASRREVERMIEKLFAEQFFYFHNTWSCTAFLYFPGEISPF